MPRDTADSLIEGLKGAMDALILGDPGDPNVKFLRAGMEEVIGADVAAGKVISVDDVVARLRAKRTSS